MWVCDEVAWRMGWDGGGMVVVLYWRSYEIPTELQELKKPARDLHASWQFSWAAETDAKKTSSSRVRACMYDTKVFQADDEADI